MMSVHNLHSTSLSTVHFERCERRKFRMEVNRDCCPCLDHGLITKWILEELNPGQANRKKLRMLQHRMQLVSILKHASLKMLSNRNYKEINYS